MITSPDLAGPGRHRTCSTRDIRRQPHNNPLLAGLVTVEIISAIFARRDLACWRNLNLPNGGLERQSGGGQLAH